MQKLVFLLVLGLCGGSAASAAESLVIPGTGLTGSFTIPNAAPYNTLGSFHTEMRIHGAVSPGACDRIALLVGFSFNLCPAGTFGSPQPILQVQDFVDSFTSSFYAWAPINNMNDFLVRFNRDVTAKRITVEVWSIDGSNFSQGFGYFDTAHAPTLPYNSTVKGASLKIAYLRWASGTVPFGNDLNLSSPPRPQGITANLGSWSFEGNGIDTSGNGRNISFSPSASYTTTPVYAPACLAGSQRAFRAGAPAMLDATMSYPLDGGSTLTYFWQQIPGVSPTVVQWPNGHSTAQPGISGMVFGSYNFRLKVTDGSGQSTSCTVHHGAVATDDNDIVTTGNTVLDTLLGPQIRWGANQWPYFDDRHKDLADHFGGLQATHPAVWNNLRTGTVSVANGSTTVTGTGTAFLSDFSCNNTDHIVIHYPYTPAGGVPSTYKLRFTVVSCASDTTLTIAQAWPTTTVTGGNYAKMTTDDFNYWFGNATHANFYDNVLGFYSLYYRSGIDIYLTYARILADQWWDSPRINQGQILLGSGYSNPVPRDRSSTGLVLRALDGRPEMWPGIRELMNRVMLLVSGYQSSVLTPDLRESAANTNEIALCALADPNSTQRTTCQAALANDIALSWANKQDADGSWLNAYLGASSWASPTLYPGTVTMTNGSTLVTGTGTTWTTGNCGGQNFWTKNGAARPVSNAEGDSQVYKVISVDSPTQLTISPAYAGSTASGRYWQCNNLVGVGVQPFMMGGFAARSFSNAYRALAGNHPSEAAIAQEFVADIWNWMISKGIWESRRGLYYARISPGCEPDPTAEEACIRDLAESRFLQAETMGGCAQAYYLSQSSSTKAACDNLYAALYGGADELSGPSGDENYTWAFLGRWNVNFTTSINSAKNFGFGFGWGGGASWPAASQGPVPANLRTLYLSFNASEVPGADQIRVTAWAPTGTQSVTTCSSSPCALSVDARLGDYVYQAEYIGPSNVVHGRGDLQILEVR